MKPPLLLLDVSNLCFRHYFALPKLMHDDAPTAVLFGFLRELVSLSERFRSVRFVFAFDSGVSLRKKACPTYKSNRHSAEREEVKRRELIGEQINNLRDILSDLGYANVFGAKGYEADDVIASISLDNVEDDVVIVSNDRDLYQLLDRGTSIWNGKYTVDLETFEREWKIPPHLWATVKAIAGCLTDCVEGIRGVGEKTAAKYIRDELKSSLKTHKAIVEGAKMWGENILLTRLPYEGCPKFTIREDDFSADAWKGVCDKYGFDTLRRTWPGRKRFLFA